jgi:PEGA domain
MRAMSGVFVSWVLLQSNAHAAPAAPSGVTAQFSVAKNATCTLTEPLSASGKSGKRAKSVTLAAGEKITVKEAPKKGSVALVWKGDTLSVSVSALETSCAPATSAPAIVAPIAMPAAREPERGEVKVASPKVGPTPTAMAIEAPAAARGKPKVGLGVLAVPPATRKAIVDSVRELIADIVRDSPSLTYVETTPPDPERDANTCVTQDACVRAVGQKAQADYVIGAWLKAEKTQGTLIFRLIDVRSGNVVKTSLRTLTNTAMLPDEVATATRLLVRDMTPEDSGTFALKINEPGVRVSIDGQAQGVSPLERKRLSGGEHTVLLEKPNFQTRKETINVEPMRPAVLDVFIEPEPDYKASYVAKNRALRGLAWTGLALTGVGAAGVFAFRVSANLLYDDLQRNNDRLQRENAPAEAYAPYQQRAKMLPVYDGLTWGAAIVGGVGLITAITCFVVSENPNKYDKPKRSRERDNEKVGDASPVDWHLAISPTSLGVFGTF